MGREERSGEWRVTGGGFEEVGGLFWRRKAADLRDWQSDQIERNWRPINQNKIGGSGIENGNLQ